MAEWLSGKLPLFRRELTELAQRRRTYLIRVIGAILLLAWVMTRISAVTAARTTMVRYQPAVSGALAMPSLGSGGVVFSGMLPVLFLMIPALLPALCCTAIAAEKEQNTFGNLLITRLSPATIVLEKLLSRIVPMMTLLLLVSPVLGYVYSLGGLDPGLLFGSIWLLFCECLLFAALSLFFSAWFPSTVSALVWSYLAAGLLVVFGSIYPVTGFGICNHAFRLTAFRSAGGAFAPVSGMELFLALFTASTVPVVATLLLLTATRLVLVRRAFVGHSSVLISLFRKLDRFFKDLNAWTTGGVELVAESNRLPEEDPITWRERHKRSLGQFRWLVRVLLVLEFPTLFICTMVAAFGSLSHRPLLPLLVLLWIFSAVLAAVKGASLFSQERSRQTLEPLLSTTLTSRELLEQKVAGTSRLLIVLGCPIGTVYLTEAFMAWRGNLLQTTLYLLLSLGLMLVILKTIVWVSTAVGIRILSQPRAIAAAITLVCLLAVIPMIPGTVFRMLGSGLIDPSMLRLGYLLSGLGAPGAIDAIDTTFLTTDGLPPFRYHLRHPTGRWEWAEVIPAVYVVCSAVILQLGWLLAARHLVLRVAPRLFQRLDSPQDAVPSLSVRPTYG